MQSWPCLRKIVFPVCLAWINLISAPVFVFAQGAFSQEEDFQFSVPLGKTYDYSRIRVSRVIDGDTLLLENGERVCLLGIDAPELRDSAKAKRDSRAQGKPLRMIKIMGKKSAQFLNDLIAGQMVRLEFDVQQKDPYGRLLAYVYAGDVFLNAEIISQGYASPVSMPPNVKYDRLFEKNFQEARREERGLWSENQDENKQTVMWTRETCQAQGGEWGQNGEILPGRCDLPTRDAGRVCRDSSECEGVCVAELTQEQGQKAHRGEVLETNGKCSQHTILLGCWPVVENGLVHGILCMD